MTFRQVREVRQRKRYGGKVIGVLIVVAALVAGLWYAFVREPDVRTVHADFAFVNGLYEGSKVTVLGVPVGRVDSLETRGDHVSVTMTVDGDVALPADVGAFMQNPSVISERHLELSPAYTDGPKLADGATIPLQRTHSPISFDQLLGSMSTLTDVLSPEDTTRSTDLSSLLNKTATAWKGSGPKFNSAMTELASASSVFGARTDDVEGLITSLDKLMNSFHAKQVSLDGLVRSMGVLADQWHDANQDITTPINDLKTVFDQINQFVTEHGDDVGIVAANLEELGEVLSANRSGLAEFMDLAPLMMQNLSSTIGPDRRGRIRLNVSTTLTQFKTLKPLCDKFPMPICVGAGLVNPISFPISMSDPLGIVSAISGGALPNRGGPR
ncbi:MCE family protein [Gordonia neofelifaecis]|uniref:Virulence factor Mce family protein n=1 Tax=Gordonia neofelifaecis NRRL B-59395 TaxID=644548 RepID=F1YKY5_9ACTN|nr:MCE family protein [Gordonia neofelifaecis]EGD54779.1 virulence factor Mce family protein [Gordonia neofelifaecis NRRL B-59395]